jgi:hypothetical protein
MSFPAPCADSARPPGMLTCHAGLLTLLKKSGKVFVTLFPRFPPLWPAPLWRQVFDVIKIATSLVLCFLQRRFHHQWQNHGAVFLMKIEWESPRSSTNVLSLNTSAVLHQIQAIILKNCSPRTCLSLFQHGHPNGWSWLTMTEKSVWQWTISNPHLLMMTPSESMPGAYVQACNPLKLSSCCKYRVYYIFITESFLQQPSLHAISALTSLFCGLIDSNMEPATQAWFKYTLYALCPMARRRIPLSPLKSREAYMILASLSPCFFWQLWNLLWLIFWIIENHQKQYTVCAHECYYSLFTCQSRSLCSFISKSLSTVGQGRWMHPPHKPILFNTYCLGVDVNIEYICVWQHKTNQ